MRALATGVLPLLLTACATAYSPAPFPPGHPASPLAEEAPLPPTSTILAAEPSPGDAGELLADEATDDPPETGRDASPHHGHDEHGEAPQRHEHGGSEQRVEDDGHTSHGGH